MSPDLTDAQLSDLLTEGLSQREISRRTGIPRSTLQIRIKWLTLQEAPAPPAGPAIPTAQVPPAPPAPTVPPTVTFVAVPEMQALLRLVKDLYGRVEALEQTRVPPALTAAPVPPAPPAVERKDVQQWTIRLSKALIDHVKAVAYERRVPPSQLVEEWLWQQVNTDRHP
jgi:hypothetical protein